MTVVGDARTKLYDAVIARAPVAAWRIHRVTPSQVVAPCAYLDSAELGPDTIEGAAIVVTTFPIVVVHDGAVRAQVEALDDMLATVYAAALDAGGDPAQSRPVNLDVGGPTLRAHVLRVGFLVHAQTFCAPSLVAAVNGGGGS